MHISQTIWPARVIWSAADFPLTRLGTSGGPRFVDILNQPGDVSFIIDSLLNSNHDGLPDLADCIDPQRIAAAGLSLGGMTTTLLAFHPQLRAPRLAAAVSIAGPVAMLGKFFFQHEAPPLMMIAGDIDAMVDYRDNTGILADWSPDTTLVTLHGGSHTGLAGVAGWLFRWFDNPDSVGCRALRGNIDEQPEVPADFMALLHGQPAEPDPGMTLRPSRDPALPRALRPQYQRILTSYPVYAFLQAKPHPDTGTRAGHVQLLDETLPGRYPGISVGPHHNRLQLE